VFIIPLSLPLMLEYLPSSEKPLIVSYYGEKLCNIIKFWKCTVQLKSHLVAYNVLICLKIFYVLIFITLAAVMLNRFHHTIL